MHWPVRVIYDKRWALISRAWREMDYDPYWHAAMRFKMGVFENHNYLYCVWGN